MSHTHTTNLLLYKPKDTSVRDDTFADSLVGFNGNMDIIDALFPSGILSLAKGGTAKALTASNGGIVYSDADSLEILSGTATAQKLLMSQSNVAPIWSTPTYPNVATLGKIHIGDGTNVVESTPKYPNASVTAGKVIRSDGTDYAASTFTIPDTMAINTILYASTANILSALATGNSGVLVTGVTGIPSIATDIPAAVTIGTKYIYRADGTDVPVADGGTGLSTVASGSVLVANALNTISALTWASAGTKMMVNTSGVLSMETVTGTGAPVLATTATLVTPILGVATATSIAIGANILNTDEWTVLDGITANKTIDHSGVSIINGNGITGGGNLTASRTLALTTLTSDWDIGDSRMIQADKIRARDGDGLALYEDGGAGIFVKDGGNVGIGTNSPVAKFDVNGSLICRATDSLPTGGAGESLEIWYYSIEHYGLVLAYDRGDSTYKPLRIAGSEIGFEEGLTRVMTIDGGNVGIGTVSPTSKLQVVGLPAYANNAAAVAGGLTAGAFYRTNGDPDLVCVVH